MGHHQWYVTVTSSALRAKVCDRSLCCNTGSRVWPLPVCCGPARTQPRSITFILQRMVAGWVSQTYLTSPTDMFLYCQDVWHLHLVLQHNSHTCLTLVPCLDYSMLTAEQLVVLLYLSSTLSLVLNSNLNFNLHPWLPRLKTAFLSLLDMTL